MFVRLFSTLLVVVACTAHASELAPSNKPIPANTSEFLDDLEFTHFRRAMVAISEDKWSSARGYRAGLSHPSTTGLVDWQIALNDKDSSYFDLADAVRTLESWPRHDRIRILAEGKIADSGMDPSAIIEWFSIWPAISGDGKVAHAEALYANHQPDAATDILREAWHNDGISKKVSKSVLKAHSKILTREDHEIRVDMLLWRHRASAAQKLLSKLGRNARLLSIARIRLMRRSRGVNKAINNVPMSLRSDPGLLYERALWRRKSGLAKPSMELALQFPEFGPTPDSQKRMWTERHIHARRAIKNRQYQNAYDLAKNHGFTRGSNFAEGEWMAGWLALRQLYQAETAYKHFIKLAEGVRTPVSKARAHYWAGMALLEMPDLDYQARAEFSQAAAFNFTYYGQLAQQQLGSAHLVLGKDPEPSESDRLIFETHPQVRALKLLALVGDTPTYRRFSYHLDDLLPGAVDHVMLARLNRNNGQAGIAVRAAKAALLRGEVLPESQWPVLEVPTLADRPESALVLALSRQESELYPRAVSRVGARGLMQLMPATARLTARKHGLPYNKGWLTDDPVYNLNIGSAHLQDLLAKFDGSYIMSAAAYNAGQSRVKKWVKDYGDPRLDINPIDWVESIPYSETRNYVQRVMENVQVYRNRITDQPALIRLQEDLNRGSRR